MSFPRLLRVLSASLSVLSLGGLAVVAACSNDAQPSAEFHFDRPADVAFGCIGFARYPDGGINQDTSVAVPLGECHEPTGAELDAGTLAKSVLVGFTPQDTRGDVVVTRLGVSSSDVGDSDPLTPKHNGLSVGTRPVSADTTPEGCFVVVANSGSCDLSLIDVFKASSTSLRGPEYFQTGAATRALVKTTSGAPLAAAPVWVTTPPPISERKTCQAKPSADSGHAYLAYPGCHMVAAVDLATNTITSSLTFAPGMAPTVGDGNVTCPQECPEVVGATAAPASAGVEPVAMAVDPSGNRLYVGARNESALFFVGLDPSGDFVTGSETRLELEGAKGLLRLAASADISMGQNGVSGTHRFVYAVAADESVHVVESDPLDTRECDTQIDPRQLRGFTDVSQLPCFPVVPPATRTLQRRPGADGPGIRLPGGSVPFDVAFLTANDLLTLKKFDKITQPHSMLLAGTFAVVTGKSPSLAGVAYFVNVDDDNYEDFSVSDLSVVDPALAMPHQLRDAEIDRRAQRPTTCDETQLLANQRLQGPVRTLSTMTLVDKQQYNFRVSVPRASYVENQLLPGRIAPLTHLELCTIGDNDDPTNEQDSDPSNDDELGETRTVFQSTALAKSAVRAKVFPDLSRVLNETWQVAWEGPLAFTDFLQVHTGGVVSPVAGKLELTLADASAPFCEMGAEDSDILTLVGCSTDADCGPSETCYFDVETPANDGGMCVERARVEELAAPCKSLYISHRRYLIKGGGGADAMTPSQVTLVPKPAVLDTSPIGGCSSDKQCQALYVDQQTLASELAGTTQPVDKTYTCQPAGELGGAKACIAVCPNNQDSECPVGSVCQDLRCVEGAFAPAECFASVQQYRVNAFRAYTVVGSISGYLHDRVADGGKCVSTGEPLRVGRFHPVEPPCTEPDEVSTVERPCSVDLAEPMGVLETSGKTSIGTRKSFGIRFRNYAFRIDIADVMSVHPLPESGPANPDTKDLLEVSLPFGYRFIFQVGGGFTARADALSNPAALLPARARLGPDGAIWIVDSGSADTQAGVRRGEMIRLKNNGIDLAITNVID